MSEKRPHSSMPEYCTSLNSLAQQQASLGITQPCTETFLSGPTVGAEDSDIASIFSRPVAVYNLNCPTAVSTALDEYTNCHVRGEVVPNRLVFWVDASVRKRKEGGIGISVVHKVGPDTKDLITKGYTVNQKMTTNSAERLAIAQALQDALCISDDLLRPEATVVDYSDSKYCLRRILDFHASEGKVRHPVVKMTMTKAGGLMYRGVDVHFRWVPSHQHVSGDALADKVARLASRGRSKKRVPSKIDGP